MTNKPNIIVSACLLGCNCKYNGGNNYCEKIEKIKEQYNIIDICPEVLGGLPTPRVPSEIVGDKVINKEGLDVTNNYNAGANLALEKALNNNCKIAILKAKSPSCGSGKIYDGTFASNLIDGDGITTRLFKQHNIKVYSEEEI
jgi:uncharacterized protein YbbK (DUF523 family)